MSWSYATSVPPSSFTALMVTTRMTLSTLTSNYTGVNVSTVCDVISDVVTRAANDEEEEYIPYSDRPETYIVPAILFLIMVIGLTGNGVLALTILRHANMRNVPNTYVLSLALGDLLLIVISVPFTAIVYILESWPFGLLLCKLAECVKDISIGVSVLTLTALSADRFFAIVDPMRKLHVTGSGRRATHFTVIVAVMIWILAIVCAIPASFSYIRVFRVNRNVSFSVCYPFPEEFGPNYPKTIIICRFFFYYMIPLSIIAVFYILMARHLMHSTKNIPGEMQGQVKQVLARKKVAKMVMAFVIIFAICFFPQHVFMLWFYLNPTAQQDYNAFWHYFRILGFCLAFTNSCINPIALYCVSGTFRKYFDRYLLCCPIKKTRRQHRRSSDPSSRGRGQSFSLVSSRKYLSESRREQRGAMRLSIMADNVRTNTPTKEQETIITLSAYPNGNDVSLRHQRISTESTAHDRLIVS
ncbi:neuropeptide CCHamide-1 receptor-like [Odontomachus brunneus]|uniref:neuropeptide CCHamide-1 receptor-like n=1 Tax=Odontomachus brunneus TaxID=486640 RepID=UPI0013F23EB2|nr:neuropeptide CCHamide-1 receptor-like [Odontomachus brunneus]XP_032685639.1 neuropeptide CCHamide-1 receptor-like [Odontomachus brunneus]XP_032685640.1 neuropeptide CCHamide-1 receptor-like [Odontomachus brunneus]